MDALYGILSWGSPIGISLFFFISCAGVGLLFWGLSFFVAATNKSKNSSS